MSWDIFVEDLPVEADSLDQIPSDFKPRCIGKRSEIIAKIKEVVPSADFSDPSWGRIEGDDWSIEVNMGDEEDCYDFAFHVHGGHTAVGAVVAILDHLKLRGLDSQTGDLFKAGPESIDSFVEWSAYRDQLLKKSS